MKYVLLIILLFAFNCVFSQNNFVYVRFDLQEVSVSDVVELVEEIYNKSNHNARIVIYVSNSNRPYKVVDWNNWMFEVRRKLLGLTVTPDFSEKEDLLQICDFFVEICGESITENLDVVGCDDNKWTYSFIVPQYMIENDIEFFAKLIYVNQLDNRNILLRYYVYSDSMKIKEMDLKLNNSNVFKYEK